MSRKRLQLPAPPLGLRIVNRLELLPPVAWVRRLRRPMQAEVFLLSYPKTGRTWVRVMLGQLLAEHYGLAALADSESAAAAPRIVGIPRILAKHDGNPQKKTTAQIGADKSEYARVKVILLVRDLRDTVVSNYFQDTRREMRYEGELSDYLRSPRGSVASMLRYYNVWAAQRHVPLDFLLLRYEDLRAGTARELARVAAFLHLDGVSPATIANAVEHGEFGAMQRRESGRPADGTPLAAGRAGDPESFKTRRGKVGGYVDYLTPEDIAWLDERIARELDPYFGYSRPGSPATPTATSAAGR